jgi:acyl carrier protein
MRFGARVGARFPGAARLRLRGRRGEMGDSLEIKVRNIVAEQLGVDLAEVTPDARILDDLGADSLDVVEMVMSIEEAFDIEVPDQDVEELRTVADVERYVTRAVA